MQCDLFVIAFFPFREVDGARDRSPCGIYDRRIDHPGLGHYRPDIQVQRYLATGDQHWDDDRHIPDGISDSEYPESR
jgi:hypothetical protein